MAADVAADACETMDSGDRDESVASAAWNCVAAGIWVSCMAARRLGCCLATDSSCDGLAARLDRQCCQSSCVLLLPPPAHTRSLRRKRRDRKTTPSSRPRKATRESELFWDCEPSPGQAEGAGEVRIVASAVVEAHPQCGGYFSFADGASSVAFTCAATRVVSGGCDHAVRVWAVEELKLECELLGHEGWVLGVAAHPFNEHMMLSTSRDETMRLWDIRSVSQTKVLRPHGTRNTMSASWSPNGRAFLTGSTDCSLRVWDAETWQNTLQLSGHDGWVTKGGRILEGGGIAISGSRDRSIRLWDLRSGKQSAAMMLAHDWDVTEVAPVDSNTVVSVSRDAMLKMWDLRMLKCTNSARVDGEELYGVTPCARNTLICVAGYGQTVHTLDLQLRPVRVHQGHTKRVAGVCAAAVGEMVASVSEDGHLRTFGA